MAPLALRRCEPLPRPASGRDELGPPLFTTPLVTVGRWRCPVECGLFHDSGPARGHLFVFPRTSVWIAHDGGRRFVADPTIVTFYNAGQRYRRYRLSPDGDRGEWFAVDRRTAADVLGTRDPAARERERVFPFTHGPSDRISYAWQRAVFEHVCRTPQPDTLLVEEAVLTILDRVSAAAYARLGPGQPRAPRDPDRVEAAQALLARRFTEPLSLRDVAAHAACSPFHLARVFRQLTGRSLHQYRTELRLRSALDALASPSGDLVSLALALGYSSHSHFTGVFRQAFGTTPSEVRGRLTSGRVHGLIERLCTARHN